MTKKSELKIEKPTVPVFKLESVTMKTNKEVRKSHYEGDNEQEALEMLTKLRNENLPHLELNHGKRKLLYVYKKRPGQKNYRLTGKKL